MNPALALLIAWVVIVIAVLWFNHRAAIMKEQQGREETHS